MATIAECPVFRRYEPGWDGLRSAKMAKAYDVLEYASMKKDEAAAIEAKMKVK